MTAPHAPPADGFPFGEPLLYLRAVPERGDRNVYCSVENVFDQPLAMIRPTTSMPAWTTTRLYADLQFVVQRPDGAPLLHFHRFGGKLGEWEQQMIQVLDASGRDLGRLRTTAPVAQFSRANGVTLGLEANGQWLGVTEVRQFRSSEPAPVFDAAGASIGRIARQELYAGAGRRYVWYADYLLDCPNPLPHPMPELMLASAFAQYLYERLAQGPVNTMFGLYK